MQLTENGVTLSQNFKLGHAEELEKIIAEIKNLGTDIFNGEQKVRVQEFIDWGEGTINGDINILCEDITYIKALFSGEVREIINSLTPKEKPKKVRSKPDKNNRKHRKGQVPSKRSRQFHG